MGLKERAVNLIGAAAGRKSYRGWAGIAGIGADRLDPEFLDGVQSWLDAGDAAAKAVNYRYPVNSNFQRSDFETIDTGAARAATLDSGRQVEQSSNRASVERQLVNALIILDVGYLTA